jgi:hypothetical protein
MPLGIFAKSFGTNLEIDQLHFRILSSTDRFPVKTKLANQCLATGAWLPPYRLYCDDQVWLKIRVALDKALVVELARVSLPG